MLSKKVVVFPLTAAHTHVQTNQRPLKLWLVSLRTTPQNQFLRKREEIKWQRNKHFCCCKRDKLGAAWKNKVFYWNDSEFSNVFYMILYIWLIILYYIYCWNVVMFVILHGMLSCIHLFCPEIEYVFKWIYKHRRKIHWDKLWLSCIEACEHYDVFTTTAVGSDIYVII